MCQEILIKRRRLKEVGKNCIIGRHVKHYILLSIRQRHEYAEWNECTKPLFLCTPIVELTKQHHRCP